MFSGISGLGAFKVSDEDKRLNEFLAKLDEKEAELYQQKHKAYDDALKKLSASLDSSTSLKQKISDNNQTATVKMNQANATKSDYAEARMLIERANKCLVDLKNTAVPSYADVISSLESLTNEIKALRSTQKDKTAQAYLDERFADFSKIKEDFEKRKEEFAAAHADVIKASEQIIRGNLRILMLKITTLDKQNAFREAQKKSLENGPKPVGVALG